MTKTWKTFGTILLMLALTLGLAQEQESAQPEEQQQAAVRIAHLAVDAPAVRLTIGGEDALDSVEAESVSNYILIPAGEHEVQVHAATGQQAQDQQDQQDQMQVEQGEVPESVRQAVQNAQQSVGEGAENAQEAIDEAMSEVDSAIQAADAEGLPVLEAIQASLQEANEAFGNDETEVAQDALDQAMMLIEGGHQPQQQDQDQDQEDGAPFSETMTFEAGNYYTIIASARQSQQPNAQQDDQQQEDSQAQLRDSVDFRLIQDDLTVPPAGSAMIRVVHASPEAASFNLVLHAEQQAQQQDEQTEGMQQDEQTEGMQQDEQTEGMQQVSQSVQEAREAIEQEDAEAASESLQEALDQIDAALEQAEGEAQSTLENMRASLEEAQQAVDQDDMQSALQSLEEAEQKMRQTEGMQQNQQTEGQQQDQQADQFGQLAITVTPRDARAATVKVVGPDGFDQDFTGENTLSQLEPGSYVASATLRSYHPAATSAEVQAGETTEIELSMERLASAGPAPIQGTNAVSDVTTGTASGYAPIPANTYTAQLQAADQDVTAVELQDLELQPGATYSMFAYGSLRDDSFSVTVTVDLLVPQGREDGEGGQDADQQSEGDAQQEGAQQPGDGDEGTDDQAVQQAMNDVRDTIQQAIDAIDQEDNEAANQRLDDANQQLDELETQAGEDRMDLIERAREGVQSARDSIEDNLEDARTTLEQLLQELQQDM